MQPSNNQAKFGLATKLLVALAVPIVFQLGLLFGTLYVQHETRISAEKSALIADKKAAQVQYCLAANKVLNSIHAAIDGPSDKAMKASLADAERLQEASPAMRQYWNPPEQVDRYTGAVVELAQVLNHPAARSVSHKALREKANSMGYGDLRRLLVEYSEDSHHWNNFFRGNPLDGTRIRTTWMTTLLSLGLLALVALIGTGIWFYRDIIFRFKRILDNIVRMGMQKPLQPKMIGEDEIVKLDHSFHEMAKALAEATRTERELVENASDVICSLDEHGKFTAISNAAQHTFGYEPEELVGTWLTDLVVEDEQSDVARLFKDHVAGGETNVPFEARMLRKDGKVIDVSWSAHWSTIEQTFFCVAHDVTARKNSERFRQDVVRMVSHDLRTPLTGLAMIYEMMEAGMLGELSARARQHLQTAVGNADRLLSVIADLLDTERIKAGMLALDVENIQVYEILEKATSAVSAVAAQKQIAIKVESCEITIDGDEHRLVQVCTNLLLYAIRVTPQHGRVTVCASGSNDSVQIKIRDGGHKIPDHLRDGLFDWLNECGSPSSSPPLSLAVSKAIAELHGGDIQVVDEPTEVGNTIVCRLPITVSLDKRNQPNRNAVGATPVGMARKPTRAPARIPATEKGSRWTLGQRCTIGLAIPAVLQLFLFAYTFSAWKAMEQESYASSLSKYAGTAITEVILKDIAMINRAKDFVQHQHPVTDAFYRDKDTLMDCCEKLVYMPITDADRRAVKDVMQLNQQLASFANFNEVQTELLQKLNQLAVRQQEWRAVEGGNARSDELRYWLIAAGAILNVAALLMFGWLFGRDIIRRLAIMLENNSRLAIRRELYPRLPGVDELSQLDGSFHTMAEAMSASLEKQRALVENARDVLLSLSSQLHIDSINNASTRVLGYAPNELVGKPISALIAPEFAVQTHGNLNNLQQGDDRSTTFEIQTIKADGKVIDVMLSATSLRDDNRIVCVARDVSEQKSAQRLRRRIAQMVADELRSPLDSITQFHQALKSPDFAQLHETGQCNMNVADLNARRMLQLVDDLLDLDRLETGTLSIVKQRISLNDVVSRSVQSIALLAEEKGVILKSEPTDVVAYADPDRLMQILLNLLGNSIKFTPPGKTISVSVVNATGNFRIVVEDEGRGIPAEILPSIFDRFKQVQSADAKEKGGSGLGLAICKALVELHDGSIAVESGVGMGTRFTIEMPCGLEEQKLTASVTAFERFPTRG